MVKGMNIKNPIHTQRRILSELNCNHGSMFGKNIRSTYSSAVLKHMKFFITNGYVFRTFECETFMKGKRRCRTRTRRKLIRYTITDIGREYLNGLE